MRRISLLVGGVVSLLVGLSAYGDWADGEAKRYDYAGDYDFGDHIVIDSEENVYVTGRGRTGGIYKCITIKYDVSGTQLWVAKYEPSGNAEPNDICESGSYVYITGKATTGSTGEDLFTIKYRKSDGGQEWLKTYTSAGSSNDKANAIAVDGSGNVYVTGPVYTGYDYKDYCTIKYDASGNQKWVAIYNEPWPLSGWNQSQDVVVDNSDNVYVTGWSPNPTGGASEYCTIKYDPSTGDTIWVRRYCGSDASYAHCMTIDASNNIYVGGEKGGGGNSNFAVVKYSPSGVQLWDATYDCAGNTDIIRDIALDGSNNVYATGEGSNGSQFSYYTVKFTSSGSFGWAKTYNYGYSSDYPKAIVVDKAGGYVYVTGAVKKPPYGYEDYCTIKYSTAGTEIGKNFYDHGATSLSARDEAYDIALGPITGCVYVTGGSVDDATSYDFATVKYCTFPVGVEEQAQGCGCCGPKLDIYPNPFTTVVSVKWSGISEANLKVCPTIQIYDLSGRLVKTLITNPLSLTTAVSWDGRDNSGRKVATGVYFLRLKAGKFVRIKKLVVVR